MANLSGNNERVKLDPITGAVLTSVGPIAYRNNEGLPFDVAGNLVVSGGTGGVLNTTLITTPSSGFYTIPAAATMVLIDAMSPGGGGGGGFAVLSTQNGWGAGGGGGGGRTTKWVEAAALRAAFPSGIPYVVGAAGVGGAPGVAGTNGGYTFCSDFFVATPGIGGGPGGDGTDVATALHTIGYGGPNGTGDTYGGYGGAGGGFIFDANQNLGGVIDPNAPDYRGTNGGYILLLFGAAFGIPEFVQLGGGGGGGGGGGVRWSTDVVLPPNTAYNGGFSGFVTTSDPNPLFGSGGVVGGAGPTAGGVPTIAASGVSGQGAGGGGAASLAGNAQSGASALPFSGGGGGGGGSCRTGHTAGTGGNGGTGYLRFTAI